MKLVTMSCPIVYIYVPSDKIFVMNIFDGKNNFRLSYKYTRKYELCVIVLYFVLTIYSCYSS